MGVSTQSTWAHCSNNNQKMNFLLVMLGCLVCFASCQPPNRNRTVNTHDDSQTTGQTPTQQATDAASSVTTKTGVDTTTDTTASSVTNKNGVDTTTTTAEESSPTILEDVKETMKKFEQDHELYLEATALKEEIPKINTNIDVEAFDHEFY